MTFQYSDKNPSMHVAYSSLNAMHTRMEIVLAGIENETEARTIISGIWDEVKKDNSRFNRFSSESDIYRINSNAYDSPENVDDEIFMILKMCEVFRLSTQGYFDITANMISRTEGSRYELDDRNHTIHFLTPETKLDLGGFAKGYTLDKIVKKLKSLGVKYALLNAGDSSSYGIGTHPYGDYWPIGLEHPYFRGKSMHEFHLKDESLSISGKDRKGCAHIIDPATGNTIEKNELITVIGASPLVTEILSTALYVVPSQIRKDIINQFPEYKAIVITPLCNGDKTLSLI